VGWGCWLDRKYGLGFTRRVVLARVGEFGVGGLDAKERLHLVPVSRQFFSCLVDGSINLRFQGFFLAALDKYRTIILEGRKGRATRPVCEVAVAIVACFVCTELAALRLGIGIRYRRRFDGRSPSGKCT
jgi:hypothetical protein